jgi:hypothetical protein
MYQDENLPTTAGTLIEATMLNSFQEELAQSIERSGQALNASSYLQLQRAMMRHGPAVHMWTGTATHEGESHPQKPATNNQTFWVDHGASLVGEVTAGTIWLRNYAGVLRQHNWSTDELAALGLDAHTFTASKDTYLQVDADSAITFVETALAAGEPTPTGTKRNAIKVVTNGSQITEVHSLVPAHPEMRALALLLTDRELEDRSTATEEGFRLEVVLNGGGGGDNLLRWQPWETGTGRANFLEVDDIQAGGQYCEVTWRFADLYMISDDGADGGSVRLRTFNGSTAEDTRYVDEHTFVYTHDGGLFWEVMKTINLESVHDGATVIFAISAVDAADDKRCYGHVEEFLLRKDPGGGSNGIQIRENSADPETTGVDADFANAVTNIQLRFYGEGAPSSEVTWRITGWVKIIPFDVTA